MKLHLILSIAFSVVLSASRATAICVASTGVSSFNPEPAAGTFEYFVSNGCNTVDQPVLSDFFLPYFSDAGISNIVVPTGWTYSIEASNNVFNLPGAGAIEFDASPPVGYFTDDFSYTASYSTGIEGPFAMDITKDGSTTRLFGDPQIPASPAALAALGGTAVPEPSSIAFLAIGWGAIALAARRRWSRSHRR